MVSVLNRFCCGILFFLVGSTAGIAAEWEMPPTLISPSNPEFIRQSMSEADDNGHVMLLGKDGSDLNAYYYNNGVWTLSTNLLTNQFSTPFNVAMEPAGTALAIFVDEGAPSVNTRYFDGSSWSTPTPDPLDTIIPSNATVAMNALGDGAAEWNTSTDIFASFFSGGTWSTPVTIASGTDIQIVDSIVYSANGTAAVVWYQDFDFTPYITSFNGTSWQTALALGTSDLFFSSLGIDDNGNVYVAGVDIINEEIIIVHYNANTSAIISTQTISTLPATGGPSIAVAPGGTAVAVWDDNNDLGYSSAFNGTTWSLEFPFSFGADQEVIIRDVSVDTDGNALVVWVTSVDSLKAARMAVGSGVWSNPSELVAPTQGGDLSFVKSALSANGTGFASWLLEIGESANPLLYANASIVAPPTNLQAQVCPDRAGSVLDCVYTLTWDASTDTNIDHYDVFRDAVLIASVDADDPLTYVDIARCQATIVYSVTAVSDGDVSSDPVSITVEPCCSGLFTVSN